MTSKFEEMGYKIGDEFVITNDRHNIYQLGEIVTSKSIRASASDLVYCESGGVGAYLFFTGANQEITPYKEESTLVPKTNTLNVGEVGGPRYEVIRKVLAVLDGDEVRVDADEGYGDYSSVKETAEYLKKSIIHQDEYPQDYQLKSEQQPALSEKDLKIKELEDNIEVMKKNLEELKEM